MVVLLQKRVGYEPEQWEDLTIPATPSSVQGLAHSFKELKNAGTYRVVLSDGTTSVFDIYRKEIFEVRIEGVVQ